MPETNPAADANPLSALSNLLRPAPPAPVGPTRVVEQKPADPSLAQKLLQGRGAETAQPSRAAESRPSESQANGSAAATAAPRGINLKDQPVDFFPTEPKSLEETGLTLGDIE